MQIGYNQATTLKNSDVETDIKYAKKYDYKYIDFQMSQLDRYLEDHSTKELKDLLDDSDISIYSLNALEFFNLKQGKEFEDIKSKFERMCRITSDLDCGTIILVSSPKVEGFTEEEVKNAL